MVDDGSEDDTRAVAKTYGERIRLERQARGRAGAARNVAVALATAPTWRFSTPTTASRRTKLEHQLAALDADLALDMVFGHVREFVSPELTPEAACHVRSPAEPSPWTSPNLMLIRRVSFDRVGPFAIDLQVAEVVDWYARAMEAGLKGLTLPEIVLERRLHTSNSGLRERTHSSITCA